MNRRQVFPTHVIWPEFTEVRRTLCPPGGQVTDEEAWSLWQEAFLAEADLGKQWGR